MFRLSSGRSGLNPESPAAGADARFGVKYIISINAHGKCGAVFMNEPRFISLRWRVILPLYVIMLVIATTGAYLLARQADGAASISPTNILQQSRRSINQQAGTLYESQRRSAQAVALVSGVPQAILGSGADDLLTTLVTRAQRSNLDDLILADADGRIVLGLRRAADGANYIRMTADIVVDLTDGFAQIDGE